MSWREILNEDSRHVLPWLGFLRIHSADRTWTVSGNLPKERGWYSFNTGGSRWAFLADKEPKPINNTWVDGHNRLRGYVVGDRFIDDQASVDPDPARLIQQTNKLYCAELGLERFARASVVQDREGRLVYVGQEFPDGPDAEAIRAYEDGAESIARIKGVTPALDLAFRWVTYQRKIAEERRAEFERLRVEEEKKLAEAARVAQMMKDVGTALGRRAVGQRDFSAAAREALRISGAELLDARESYNKGEMVIQYRFRQQRLECVVERDTLRVIDAGVCLADHETGFKGDRLFTLESLPGVIGEAIDLDKLVVWRHA
jgi:hypothetical protein